VTDDLEAIRERLAEFYPPEDQTSWWATYEAADETNRQRMTQFLHALADGAYL
jgi:hypothetical protein